jgi:hypothetical protein
MEENIENSQDHYLQEEKQHIRKGTENTSIVFLVLNYASLEIVK